MVTQDVGKQSLVLRYLPLKLQLLLFHSPLMFPKIFPRSEHSLKPHFFKKPLICLRMSKRIKLPADSGYKIRSKSFCNKLVPDHKVCQNVLIAGCRFVIGNPATSYELKLVRLGDKVVDLVSLNLILLIPPHLKVFHFSPRKLPFWVIK